jgi:methylglyoxal synthase
MQEQCSAPRHAIEKTLIGVLASHDDCKPNKRLVALLSHFYNHAERKKLEQFHFVFTGGTYDRIFQGNAELGVAPLPKDVQNWLRNCCGVTRLPTTHEGGVIILTYLISQRECSLVWPFYAPNANHWQRNENLAFMRLCDQWHVKRLMNTGSVLAWFDYEAEEDAARNLHPCPPQLRLEGRDDEVQHVAFQSPPDREPPEVPNSQIPTFSSRAARLGDLTIALIAHDEMKGRMVEFAIDHEKELDSFNTIVATGTTGREVAAATSKKIERKMVRYHAGPKGGDIEIATAILYDRCHVVIFFVDPLRPHPHIEDIRVVFQACMVSDNVLMITNEMHAREFMSRVVRGKDNLVLYDLR